MQKRSLLVLPLLALTSLTQADGKDARPAEIPECGMKLPSVQMVEHFKGPVSGPFILAANNNRNKPDQNSFTLLSMNIQNIPDTPDDLRRMGVKSVLNPDYRLDRKGCLTNLSYQFDAVAFQEDIMKRQNTSPSAWHPDSPDPNPLVLSSGLSFQSSIPYQRIEAKPYSHALCSGWVGKKNDCFAAKGFQIVKISDIYIVNTHLDSGRATEDHDARYGELLELTHALQALPQDARILLVGDLNLNFKSPRDEAMVKSFTSRNGLHIFARYSSQKGHDFIMGRNVDINWIGTIKDPLLSDHEGRAVNINLSRDSKPVYASLSM